MYNMLAASARPAPDRENQAEQRAPPHTRGPLVCRALPVPPACRAGKPIIEIRASARPRKAAAPVPGGQPPRLPGNYLCMMTIAARNDAPHSRTPATKNQATGRWLASFRITFTVYSARLMGLASPDRAVFFHRRL